MRRRIVRYNKSSITHTAASIWRQTNETLLMRQQRQTTYARFQLFIKTKKCIHTTKQNHRNRVFCLWIHCKNGHCWITWCRWNGRQKWPGGSDTGKQFKRRGRRWCVGQYKVKTKPNKHDCLLFVCFECVLFVRVQVFNATCGGQHANWDACNAL